MLFAYNIGTRRYGCLIATVYCTWYWIIGLLHFWIQRGIFVIQFFFLPNSPCI